MNENEIQTVEQETASGEKKKGSFTGLIHKIADKGHQIMTKKADKKRTDAYLKQLEKYKPVYEEAYFGGFYMPNLLVIEDDTRRNEAEVLNCAVGWVEKDKETEVFHLFEDAVGMSGLKLLPNVQCGSLYYVDSFDKNTYMRVECIFDIVRNEKLAELKHIAQCLGAKKCSIEITSNSTKMQDTDRSVKRGCTGIEDERSKSTKEFSSGKIDAQFSGVGVVKRPTLKWFASDLTIQGLIETRCLNENAAKTERIELKGSTYATMSRKTACSIDSAVKKFGGGSASIENQATCESESTLIFSIEF